MQHCQSCLSTAPAVLIYRQLYLVVMFFFGIKTACLSGIEKDWWHTVPRSWSLCPNFAFYCLLHLPSWSDAISSGSVNPHLSPFSGPTESLLANASWPLIPVHTLHNPQGHLIPSPQPAESDSAQHKKYTLTQRFIMLTLRHKYWHTQTHSSTISYHVMSSTLLDPVSRVQQHWYAASYCTAF